MINEKNKVNNLTVDQKKIFIIKIMIFTYKLFNLK